MNELSKGLKIQGRTEKKASISEDFGAPAHVRLITVSFNLKEASHLLAHQTRPLVPVVALVTQAIQSLQIMVSALLFYSNL